MAVRRHGRDYKKGTHATALWKLVDAASRLKAEPVEIEKGACSCGYPCVPCDKRLGGSPRTDCKTVPPKEAEGGGFEQQKCNLCGQPLNNGSRHGHTSGYGDFATVSCSAAVEPKEAAPEAAGLWVATPDCQGYWWRWDKNPDVRPFIYHVQVSKSGPDRYFIDYPDSRWCDEVGGEWEKVADPVQAYAGLCPCTKSGQCAGVSAALKCRGDNGIPYAKPIPATEGEFEEWFARKFPIYNAGRHIGNSGQVKAVETYEITKCAWNAAGTR